MKKFIIVAVTLGLISGAYFLFFAKSSPSFTDIVAEKERAVFHIFSYDSHGTPTSTGTGFFIDEKGTGITNFHVIQDVSIAYIKDFEGNVFKVNEVTKIAELADLAEIKINNDANKEFTYISKSDQEPVKGQDVFIIGNPIRLESTLSTGIISSIRDNDNFEEIQFTAPISGGSSGSPIMNMQGELLAVVTSGYDSSDGQNLNFGTTIASLNDLEKADGLIANLNSKNEIYLLNQNHDTETAYILNSIEKKENKTLVNLTFTNLSIQYIHNIMIDIGNNYPFYIEDSRTKKRFNLIESNAGTSVNPQSVNTGETVKFTLVFPPIPKSTDLISIIGETADYNYGFFDISLKSTKPNLVNTSVAFSASTLNFALEEMLDEEYYSAFSLLENLLEEVENFDEESYYKHVQGLSAFLYGDTLLAKDLFEESINLNPMSSSFQQNMYYTYNSLEMYNDALQNLNSLISLNPNELAYRRDRVELYYELNETNKMLNETNYIIDNDVDADYMDYYNRAIAKASLDMDPCDDLYIAYYDDYISEEMQDVIYDQYYEFGCD